MPDLEGTAVDIARGLEALALDDSQGIRPRAAAASRLLELSGVDPISVSQLTCDPLPEACKGLSPQYRRLREWVAGGYVAPPVTLQNHCVEWSGRSCIEAVLLAQLLRRGIRGDALADIIRRARRTPASTLAALASEPVGVDKLYDPAGV